MSKDVENIKRTLLRDAELLAQNADQAARWIKDVGQYLDLAETRVVVESLGEAVEAIGGMFASAGGRVGQIIEREMTEQAGRTTPELLDSAVLNLDLGCDGLTVALHLLKNARSELLKVERGEDV